MENSPILQFFDRKSNRFYKLHKTGDLPCLEISGIKMHCVKIGVKKSATAMASQLSPLQGIILDTCGGLGYTAIRLAQSPRVKEVRVFEIDLNVIEIAKQNPDSKELFSNPKIILKNESSFDSIKSFPDASFDRILHDPPRFSLAGELYGQEFYNELFRVLKPNSILFHYTGKAGEKSGKKFRAGIIRRLEEAGFKKIVWNETAQGFRAEKQQKNP